MAEIRDFETISISAITPENTILTISYELRHVKTEDFEITFYAGDMNINEMSFEDYISSVT